MAFKELIDVPFHLYFTETQHTWLKNRAAELGTNVSALVRSMINDEILRVTSQEAGI